MAERPGYFTYYCGKGAPLCRYIGVTRMVPFKSAPKIEKRCPMGIEKVRAPRGNKIRGNRGINLRRQSSYSPSEK